MVLLPQVPGTHCLMLSVAASIIPCSYEHASDAAAFTGIILAGLVREGLSIKKQLGCV